MKLGSLRRRPQGGDVEDENYGTPRLSDLDEPYHSYDDKHYKRQISKETWDEERRKADLQWAYLCSTLISQWTHWIANIVHGSGSLIVHYVLLPFNILSGNNHKLVPPALTPLQEERLRKLQQRLQVPFDGSRVEHQDALWQLWALAYPDRELSSLKSELWKDMGWQGPDPSTDFRGGGFVSLENLNFFAKNYPDSFQSLLHKLDGNRADWEYPFAIAGLNISFMLIQMLNLHSGMPWCLAGIRFLELLGEDETAFDHLYCVAFKLLDAQWLVKRASYMDFNDILQSTRTQLEYELAHEHVTSVKNLPAFKLLRR